MLSFQGLDAGQLIVTDDPLTLPRRVDAERDPCGEYGSVSYWQVFFRRAEVLETAAAGVKSFHLFSGNRLKLPMPAFIHRVFQIGNNAISQTPRARYGRRVDDRQVPFSFLLDLQLELLIPAIFNFVFQL